MDIKADIQIVYLLSRLSGLKQNSAMCHASARSYTSFIDIIIFMVTTLVDGRKLNTNFPCPGCEHLHHFGPIKLPFLSLYDSKLWK